MDTKTRTGLGEYKICNINDNEDRIKMYSPVVRTMYSLSKQTHKKCQDKNDYVQQTFAEIEERQNRHEEWDLFKKSQKNPSEFQTEEPLNIG